MPLGKVAEAAAVQDAVRDTMIPEIREAFWTAPALALCQKTKCPRGFRMIYCVPMTK
jgi:hypothetical protein